MATIQCNVTFFRKGKGAEGYSSYLLVVGELPDQGITVATIVVLADDGQGPLTTYVIEDGSDIDGALEKAITVLEERHPSDDWSKLSNCT